MGGREQVGGGGFHEDERLRIVPEGREKDIKSAKSKSACAVSLSGLFVHSLLVSSSSQSKYSMIPDANNFNHGILSAFLFFE